MYEIINKRGEGVSFKDDCIHSVMLAKNGMFSSKIIIHAGKSVITFDKMNKADAEEHYNVLHDMIIDQELDLV